MRNRSLLLTFAILSSCSQSPPRREQITIHARVPAPAGCLDDSPLSRWIKTNHVNDTFAIDRELVSCEEYEQCARAGACPAPYLDGVSESCDGWRAWAARDAAASYCRWRGLRLPTLGEWQAAMRTSDNGPQSPSSACDPYVGPFPPCDFVAISGVHFSLAGGEYEWTDEYQCTDRYSAPIAVNLDAQYRLDQWVADTKGTEIRGYFRCVDPDPQP